MANGTIRLPEEGAGPRLDTESLSVGGQTVHRERMLLAGLNDVDLAQVVNTLADTVGKYGLVVRQAEPDSVQTNRATSSAVAAGSSDDLDSAQITSSKTGQLMQLVVAASVPFKVDLKTVADAVETTVLTLFSAGNRVEFVPATRRAFTQAQSAGAGFDGFRATVTNLDTSEAADLYATFIWDEV